MHSTQARLIVGVALMIAVFGQMNQYFFGFRVRMMSPETMAMVMFFPLAAAIIWVYLKWGLRLR
jgi:hypothetical protein